MRSKYVESSFIKGQASLASFTGAAAHRPPEIPIIASKELTFMSLGPVGSRIVSKLTAAFAPDQLLVEDQSEAHAGHAGARPEGETHFSVKLVSKAFEGKSRIERHRMVNGALADELAARVHALTITAKAPGEP
jgi:BolA family transcriptional regulator, general stress-responsive regulator